MTITLIDLFKEIGSENITYQVLGQVMTGMEQTDENYTEISFITDQITVQDVQAKTENKIALIVWADKEQTERALEVLSAADSSEEAE